MKSGQNSTTEKSDTRKGFDHGVGHPLLFLDDIKASNCRKNNWLNGLGNYSEWPKVADAVIKAQGSLEKRGFCETSLYEVALH